MKKRHPLDDWGNSEISALIDEHIHNERDRRLMKRRLCDGVEPGRDEVSYRRGRDSMGRYTSRGGYSYGDSEHTAKIVKRMMQGADPEEREVLEKCLDMVEQYA